MLIAVSPGLVRKGWHLDLNWLVCVKLGLWSFQLFDTNVLHGCWLFWQNEILFLAFPSFIYIFVSFYVTSPPALNWDCGHVSCCTNVLHESWFFDKMRTWISSFQHQSLISRFEVFDLSEWSRILVVLTVLPTSFVGVNSIDKSSIFLASHFPCQCFILVCLHTLLLTCSA